MRNYKLDIADFRYPKEKPVLMTTMTITAILIILMFVLALPLGIGLLISIALLIFNLHTMQTRMLGASVRVSETQFPKIHKMAQLAADRLDIPLPPVYIIQSPVINAFATGFFGNYFIVLHSATIEACTDEELMMIIGHEFTHVKGNHVMLNALMNMGVGNGMKLFPGLSWLQFIIRFVFLYLSRCFEYTCDRGGLIANGDIKASVTAQTKLAVGKELFSNLNIMEFYKQALELDKKPLGFMAEIEATHPLTVHRIREAVRFYRSDTYRKIAAMQGKTGTATLQGSLATGDLMQKIVSKQERKQPQNQQNNYENINSNPAALQKNTSPVGQAQFCKSCGSQRKGDAAFCASCGTKFEQRNVKVNTIPVSPKGGNLNTVPVDQRSVSLNTTPVTSQEEDLIPVIEVQEVKNESTPGIQSKFCRQCGIKNLPKAVFCTECGGKF